MATEAGQTIQDVEGNKTIYGCVAQHWFKDFKDIELALEIKFRNKPPSIIDYDVLNVRKKRN